MHKCARFATTAGATVLTFAAMSGAANADPVGDLTGGLTDTVGNVTSTVTGGAVRVTSQPSTASRSTSSTRQSGGGSDPSVGLNVDAAPVRAAADVSAEASSDRIQAHAALDAGVSGASGAGASVRADVDVCFAPEGCGEGAPGEPPPPTSPGPGPSTPPAMMPPGSGSEGAGPLAPGASSEATIVRRNLPLTGGPLGGLVGLGVGAVLTGAAAVAGSRYIGRRETG